MDSGYRSKCVRVYNLSQHGGWGDIQRIIDDLITDATKVLINEYFTTLEEVVRKQAEIEVLNKFNGRVKELIKKGESYIREEK